MKRGLFGAILLVLLLAGGLLQRTAAREELSPIAADMDRASQAVLRGDLTKTAALTASSRAAWEQYRLKYSCLTEQQEIRSIDCLFDEAEVFLTAGEKVHCSAACAELKNLLQALKEDQSLSIPHLL